MSNELIRVEMLYKRKGLATQIYLNEDKYYRSIGVNRIDIRADEDGRNMWAKKEFGFEFKDYSFVEKQFNSWLISNEGKLFLKSDKGKIYLQSIKNEGKSIYNLGNNPYLYSEYFLSSDGFMNTIFYRKYLR